MLRANIVRLYDIQKDPHEINDLAGNKKYRKIMDKLFKRFQELQQEIKDPLDVRPYYNAFMTNNESSI